MHQLLLMKYQNYCFVFLFLFLAAQTHAQHILGFSTGLATDLNNKKPFYTIPLSLRWEPFKRSSLFIETIVGVGFPRKDNADAYTTNPDIPEHVVLIETKRLNSLSIGVGGVIPLYTNKKNNRISLLLSLGGGTEYFRIDYKNYDNVNYEVLNPDVDINISGMYVSTAAMYSFHKRKRDMFVMLRLQSPSTGRGRPDVYNLSFQKTAPMELTFGYNLFYLNRK